MVIENLVLLSFFIDGLIQFIPGAMLRTDFLTGTIQMPYIELCKRRVKKLTFEMLYLRSYLL